MNTPFSIDEVSFRDLPGWREDDPGKLFPAMGTILSHLRNSKPYRTGALGVTAAELVSLLEAAEEVKPIVPNRPAIFSRPIAFRSGFLPPREKAVL